MASVEVVNVKQEIYQMVVTKKRFPFNRDTFPTDVILPIYNGRKLDGVLRELPIPKTDFQAVDRLVFGPSMKTVFMHALDPSAGEEAMSLFRALVCKYQEFRNKPAPLVLAIKEGNWRVADVLLAAGALKNSRDEDGNGVFHMAVMSDRFGILEKLLARVAREVNQRNNLGQTALQLAVQLKKPEYFYRLIGTEFCDTNVQDRDGNSLFHMIVRIAEDGIRIPMLNRLLSNLNFNAQVRNKDGLTAMDLAVIIGAESVVDLICRTRPQFMQAANPRGVLPFHLAAEFGKSRILELILVNDRCDVGRMTNDGRTALHFAVSRWGADVKSDADRMISVQLLVCHNINVNLKCKITGDTAAHLVLREVMKKGPIAKSVARAIMNSANMNHRLDKIAQLFRPNWPLATLCYLCLKGADLTLENKEGETLLTMWDNPDVVNICQEMSKHRARGFFQMNFVKSAVAFDTSLLAMCTFNCDNSTADVRFIPCGHKIICSKCVETGCFIPYQCSICHQNIMRLRSDNGDTWDCEFLRDNFLAVAAKADEESDERNPAEEEADPEAPLKRQDLGAEEESSTENMGREIQQMEAEIVELEELLTCPICVDEQSTVIFCCGHSCCASCSGMKMMKYLCPMCRQPIAKRYNFQLARKHNFQAF
ncbi:hypothetical protein L596_022571 [Steinernema carpocapsae]|uniref:RING-type domain-containing protein n=1 Tax=Steinernema carpocapsae TaxID=34508 RepID=A0A4U5MM75_STECR|nr:hypothetical protein L596_022571 [Steinernema carpocapsae]